MTSPSLAQLDAELQAAEAEQERLSIELEEINKRRWAANEAARLIRQKKEQLALTRETEIRVCDLTATGAVNIKILPDMRPDILPIIRSIPGRTYDATVSVNRMSLEAWNNAKKELLKLPNVKITHLLGVEEKIQAAVNRPEFHVLILGKDLRIVPHPQAYKTVITDLPGGAYATSNGDLKLPLSEAWRLLDVFEKYRRFEPGVPITSADDGKRIFKWEPSALALAENELRKRAKLDEILLMKDAPLDIKFHLGQELMPFQRVGVHALDTLDGVGFLADQMGLGKTWQAIALALLRGARVVVVCPAHLKANWMREIINLTGIIPEVLYGREPDADDVNTLVVKKPRFVIINYDILGSRTEMEESRTTDEEGRVHVKPKHNRYLWADLINMSKPDLIVLDEAHYIKNSEAHRSKACTSLVAPGRLPMSGTPILNRPGEFFAALHWLQPEVFPDESRFLGTYTNNGKGARNVAQLRELLRPIMIRRLKKDVVADLPAINRIERYLELSPEGKLRYAEVLAGVYRAIDKAGNEVERNITSILVEIGKLKEVCAMDAVPHVVEHAIDLNDTESDAATHGEGKVLIFSYYKHVVQAIAHKLGCPFWTGDTPMETRNRLEKQFQEDANSRFLVVSLMSGQTGLNLTAAGHVIFADLYWTPAAHAQAEERAYGRLSDLHGADSYYFMATGTIMEWVWTDMILPKIALINEVVEGMNEERDVNAFMGIIERFKQLRGSL